MGFQSFLSPLILLYFSIFLQLYLQILLYFPLFHSKIDIESPSPMKRQFFAYMELLLFHPESGLTRWPLWQTGHRLKLLPSVFFSISRVLISSFTRLAVFVSLLHSANFVFLFLFPNNP